MQVFQKITTFIIDEWLYSVSWGAYHVPITIFIMLFLFKVVLRMRMITAVFLTLIINVSAMALFSVSAMAIAHISTYDYAHIPQELHHPLIISIGLGLIYATLQTILFFIISRRYTLKLPPAIAVSFVSNILAALCVYMLPIN